MRGVAIYTNTITVIFKYFSKIDVIFIINV